MFSNIRKEFSYEEYKFIKSMEESTQLKETIDEFYKKNKDFVLNNNIAQFYLMGISATPIEVIKDIINSPMSSQVMLKALENETIGISSYSDALYNKIINSVFPETLKEHLHKRLISSDALNFLVKEIDFRNDAAVLITDEGIAEKLLNRNPYDEKLRVAIANNFGLNDRIRNKAFDEGCNFEEIVNVTPHMISCMYESAIETLSMVTNVEEQNFKSAHKVLDYLIKKGFLSESQQLDIVMRYATETKPGYARVFSTLYKNTDYKSVFDKIVETKGKGDINSVYIRDIFLAENIPDSFLGARVRACIENIKDQAFVSRANEILIYKALSRECITKSETYEYLVRMNNFGFFDAISKDVSAPNDVLREIIKRTINSNYSNIAVQAALNIAMNKCNNINNKKTKNLYFRNVIASVNKISLRTYHNSLENKTEKFAVPVFAHIFNSASRECLIKDLREAKKELKENIKTQNFIDKLIDRFEESMKKDDLFIKLNIKLSSYDGECKKEMFDKDFFDIYYIPSEKLENTLKEFSLDEIICLKEAVMKDINDKLQSTDSFVATEHWIKFYRSLDNYLKVYQAIEKEINEKEKVLERVEEKDER